MIIRLTPVRLDAEPLTAVIDGDVITVNGVTYDFSPLLEGETLPTEATPTCFAGDVSRIDGVIHLTLLLSHGDRAPEETRYPVAFYTPIEIEFGELDVPMYNLPEPEVLPEIHPEPEVLLEIHPEQEPETEAEAEQ